MKVTDLTRRALATRREQRDMERNGWTKHETDWQIVRGSYSQCSNVIIGVQISADGKHVWTKVGEPGEKP